MSDRLLNKNDIAVMLSTTGNIAADVLASQGVMPINFGMGRGRGPRWLESAVLKAIKSMHIDAQNIVDEKKAVNKKAKCARQLFDMSIDELMLLTKDNVNN